MANTTIAVTPGSGATVGVYNDASSVAFQRVLSRPDGVQAASFGAAYIAQSAGTGATTNIFTIAGSATKTVKITRLDVSSTTATAASYYDVILKKQSTADTGGTAATAATIVKLDSAGAAATAAAPAFYTAAPTAGTTAGTLAVFRYFSALTGTPAPTSIINTVGVPGRAAAPITLNGVAEVLAVTLNSVTPANAQSWDIFVEWTEE